MTPNVPMKPCNWPSCPNLVPLGTTRCENHRRCDSREQHARRRQNPENRKLDDFYSSAAWRAARSAHLVGEPLCRVCKKVGTVTAGEMVDHILPIRMGGDPLNDANLQTLCNSCHGAKQIREGSRYGK